MSRSSPLIEDRLDTGETDGDGEEYVDAWVVHGDFRKIGYKDSEEQGGVGIVKS